MCRDDEVALSASARTSSSGARVATLQKTLVQEESESLVMSCIRHAEVIVERSFTDDHFYKLGSLAKKQRAKSVSACGKCCLHVGVLCPDCGVGVPRLFEHCIQ